MTAHRPGPLGWSDAAKRCADVVNVHLITDPEGNRGRWVAIRLSDGGSDGCTYPDVSTAANCQLHWQTCMYVAIPWDGMTPTEADVLLSYHRRVYDSGNHPPYLDGYTPVVPRAMEHLR